MQLLRAGASCRIHLTIPGSQVGLPSLAGYRIRQTPKALLDDDLDFATFLREDPPVCRVIGGMHRTHLELHHLLMLISLSASKLGVSLIAL